MSVCIVLLILKLKVCFYQYFQKPLPNWFKCFYGAKITNDSPTHLFISHFLFRIITGDKIGCINSPQIPSSPSGTIIGTCFCNTLNKLKSAIRLKRQGLLTPGILFLDDKSRPNTARYIKEHILRLGWERLDDPEYSPDLAPSDFHLFPASKSALSGRHSEAMKRCGRLRKTSLARWAPIFTRMVFEIDFTIR
ncbi:hypothetical protein AVEN_241037-1 [Araneus ventricosus]|uniref:Histone-lysine N-methyltransferase SETMAR n=1 Tax=Araneus ventricosus TaxID=182803 RepID=A0A4Y2IA85_ARAVE|nr:hypothetical protein AVEN_241037-1 [Araneus ventricosus]